MIQCDRVEAALQAIEARGNVAMVVAALEMIESTDPDEQNPELFSRALAVAFDCCVSEADFRMVEELRCACLGS